MKILVITVGSWNSKVGANTWASLLEGYDSAQIANLYFRNEQPDSAICSRYFNISENKIIRSVFNRRISTGHEVSISEPDASSEADLLAHNARYKKLSAGKRRYSLLLLRELIWKLGRWKTPELDVFLDDFKPDIILHSMDGYIHANRVARYAIRRTGAKAVGYMWDDNFTYKQSSVLGYKVYRYFQRASLKKLAKITTAFFAISPYTKKEADNVFGVDCKVLTKPLNAALVVPQQYGEKKTLRMLYTGNLRIGRHRSLIHLADALRQLNSKEIQVVLDVYTQTELPPATLRLLQTDYCHIHAAIPQTEVLKKQKESDILLFLEDIDGKDAKVARLSFSTKLTDYLSCGKCIFAIGNRDTAPMQYFIENDAAVVCDHKDKILPALQELCDNTERLNYYARNACQAGIRNHNPEDIRRIFWSTLEEVYQAKLTQQEENTDL